VSVDPSLLVPDESLERFQEVLRAAEAPEGEAPQCCRFINPTLAACRHPGRNDGTLGCIAFILGQFYQLKLKKEFRKLLSSQHSFTATFPPET
jgi:hypothetical protein